MHEGSHLQINQKYFGIRGNPKKSQVLEFFKINLNEISIG